MAGGCQLRALSKLCCNARTFSFDFSLICAWLTTGDAVWPATFLLRSSSACASAPVVRAVAILEETTGCSQRMCDSVGWFDNGERGLVADMEARGA
jgi:hypothetical protein